MTSIRRVDAGSDGTPGTGTEVDASDVQDGPVVETGLEELLREVLARVDEIVDDQHRLQLLLDAVVGLASDLSLDGVLQRVVKVACDLAGARYAALGVLGSQSDRRLQAFVTHGLTQEQRDLIGDLPRGRGLLGRIIDQPEPLRLHDIAEDPNSYGFPANHPPMRSFLGVPLRVRDRIFGNLYLTEKSGGGDFTESDESVVSALAAAAGVMIENAQLYEEGVRRERWLAATAEIAGMIATSGDSEAVLQTIADRAREVAKADVATIVLRRSETDLELVITSGEELLVRPPRAVSMAGSLAGQVVASGEVLVVPDLAADPRTAEDLTREYADRASPGPRLGPAVLVPLRTTMGVQGALCLAWTLDRQPLFREVDVALPGQFAEQAAVALQVSRARADQERLMVFEDRDRIGRDLHDLVIQRLFAVGLSLENTSRMLADRPEVAHRVAAAVDDLDSTIKDIRRSIFALSSAEDSTDVRRAALDLVERAERMLKFRPSLRFAGPVSSTVSAAVAPHLTAVLAEALSNVIRHAEATRVEVVIEAGDDIVLTVRDDGRGLPDDASPSGLANIAQRAEQLGGSCEVQSSPGGGTVVAWRVPAR